MPVKSTAKKTATPVKAAATSEVVAQALNFDTPDSTFDPLPDGTYTVVLDKVNSGRSKEKKTPFIKLTLKVTEGEFKNRLIWYTAYWLPTTVFQVKRAAKAFEVELKGNVSMTKTEQLFVSKIGQTANALIIEKDGFNEVKKFIVAD